MQYLHIVPYIDPRKPSTNGTSAVLNLIARLERQHRHVFLCCGDAPGEVALGVSAVLQHVPVRGYRQHYRTEQILRQAVSFAKWLRRNRDVWELRHHEEGMVIAHGPESAIFADRVRGECGAMNSIWTVQTHFILGELLDACHASGLPTRILPEAVELQKRHEAFIGALGAFDAIYTENARSVKGLREAMPCSLKRVARSPLVAFDSTQFTPGGKCGLQDVFVVAGRCSFEKGHDLAIRAFAMACDRSHAIRQYELRLFLNGRDGTPYPHQIAYHQYVRQLVAKGRVEGKVSVSGGLAKPELAEVLRRAAGCLVPSRYEPFGILGLEATACGCKVAVADCAGVAEFGGGLGMRVFRSADVEQLANILVGFAREKGEGPLVGERSPDIGKWSEKRVLNVLERRFVESKVKLPGLQRM